MDNRALAGKRPGAVHRSGRVVGPATHWWRVGSTDARSTMRGRPMISADLPIPD